MRRLKSEYDSLPLAESKLSLLLGIIAVIGTVFGLVNYFSPKDPAPPANPDDPFPNTNQAQQEFTEEPSAK